MVAEAPVGELLLTKLGINPSNLFVNFSGKKLDHYIAVVNWLKKYKPKSSTTNLEKVKGYIQAFYHLCEVEDWKGASQILFSHLNTSNNEELGEQLGTWGYYREKIQLYSKLLGKLSPQRHAICLNNLGTAYNALCDFTTARSFFQDSLSLFQKLGEKEHSACVFHNLGLLEADCGKDNEALAFYGNALELFQELADVRGIASVFNDIARVETAQGNYPEAIKHYKMSLNLYLHKLEDKKGCGWVLYNLGRCFADQGEYVESRKYTRKGLQLFREIEFRSGIAWSLYSLSILMLNLGRNTSARVYSKAGLELFRELADRSGIAWSLHILGRIAFRQSEYRLSSQCYRENILIHQDTGNLLGLVYGLEGFARLAVVQSQKSHFLLALKLFGAAEALRESLQSPLPLPDRDDHERSIASVRSKLDEGTFIEEWALGRAMSVEQAIIVALDIGIRFDF